MRTKSRGRILLDMRRHLDQVAGIDSTNPTGVLNNLMQGVADTTEQLWQEVASSFDQSVLRTASGTALDEIGRSFGVSRKARSSASSRNSQVMYVKTGTFGDLSNGNPILIPNGTTISTPDGTHVVKVFTESNRTQGGLMLDPTLSEQQVPVISLSEDPFEVIQANTLTVFNGPVSGIKTRNLSAIRAEAVETDDNYRFRIESRRRGDKLDNTSQLLYSLLSVPGVSNVRLLPFSRGGGSMDILVIGVNGSPDAETLNLVRNAAQRNSASTFYTVRGVKTALLRMSVVGQQTDRVSLNREFLAYIDTLAPGKPFLLEEYRVRVSASFNFGHAFYNGVKTFNRVITLPEETVFIADSSVGDPVQVASS